MRPIVSVVFVKPWDDNLWTEIEYLDRSISPARNLGWKYDKWFMSPIPPKGVSLNLPMSEQLKVNLKELSDKPAL